MAEQGTFTASGFGTVVEPPGLEALREIVKGLVAEDVQLSDADVAIRMWNAGVRVKE